MAEIQMDDLTRLLFAAVSVRLPEASMKLIVDLYRDVKGVVVPLPANPAPAAEPSDARYASMDLPEGAPPRDYQYSRLAELCGGIDERIVGDFSITQGSQAGGYPVRRPGS